jgi:hypothetical protein
MLNNIEAKLNNELARKLGKIMSNFRTNFCYPSANSQLLLLLQKSKHVHHNHIRRIELIPEYVKIFALILEITSYLS